MTVETIADIDVQIVSARWRWLHGTWDDKVDAVNRAKAAIDLLLERRYELMRAAAAGRTEAAQQETAMPASRIAPSSPTSAHRRR
ncbi:MAG: hypothetical protein ABI775_05545 [Pseudonocardiales bacterium]